jgi:hypothetical protein
MAPMRRIELTYLALRRRLLYPMSYMGLNKNIIINNFKKLTKAIFPFSIFAVKSFTSVFGMGTGITHLT